jgi:hypothetical protein
MPIGVFLGQIVFSSNEKNEKNENLFIFGDSLPFFEIKILN